MQAVTNGISFEPAPENVFRAFNKCPYDNCCAVILGQDPYPQKGVATGIAFGNDLTKTDSDSSFAVNSNSGIYQLFHNGYLLQFNGVEPVALYDYVSDSMLTDNLIGRTEHQEPMLLFLKSVIQQYMERVLAKDGLLSLIHI